MHSDAEYFRKRGRDERRAAKSASLPIVRLRHLEFAQAYELRVRELDAQEVRSAIRMADAREGAPRAEPTISLVDGAL